MTGQKIIEYVIGAKDATANAIGSALARVRSFGASVLTNLQNIRAGFGMLQTAASNAVEFMRKAFAFESMTVQFKTLIGSMDEARAHMQMLQDLGNTPPFSLEEFAEASRSMLVMTEGVLGFKKSLELVGDAAAATGRPVQELAHEVGRAYAIIRDGQPITRATMALRNMGVLTPAVAKQMEDMQKAGEDNALIWKELEDALKRYKGAMAETEETGNGLIGAIGAEWDNTMRAFGEACLETAKDGLGGLLEWMRELRENGTIGEWASDVADSLNTVKESIQELTPFIEGTLGNLWKLTKGTVGTVWAFAANADQEAYNGGGFMDQVRAGWGAAKALWNSTWNGDPEEEQMKEDRRATARAAAIKRESERKAEYAKKEAEEEVRIKESLAEGQRKTDEKNALEKAKADQEAARKAAEAAEKAAKKEEAERMRLEEKLHAKRIQLMTAELNERQKAEAEAANALAAAQAKTRQAWGWYRDKDSLASQIAEEKADAAAQKQFEKDFDRLRRRRSDWRTATNLSLDDEAVRRVGVAREEEAKAAEYARQTAEAAQSAAEALDVIKNALTEGE